MKFILYYAGLPIHLHTNACGKHFHIVAQDKQASQFNTYVEAESQAKAYHVPQRHLKIKNYEE